MLFLYSGEPFLKGPLRPVLRASFTAWFQAKRASGNFLLGAAGLPTPRFLLTHRLLSFLNLFGSLHGLLVPALSFSLGTLTQRLLAFLYLPVLHGALGIWLLIG